MPIERAGRQVAVQRDAAIDGDEDDRERQRPGQQELQVVAGRSGQRAAEQVGEHEREQHGDADDVA
jgi:hypothetical protein